MYILYFDYNYWAENLDYLVYAVQLIPTKTLDVFWFQVGYGDISCKTDLGKLFISLYMMGTIVMFAQFIPEIGRNLMDRPR